MRTTNRVALSCEHTAAGVAEINPTGELLAEAGLGKGLARRLIWRLSCKTRKGAEWLRPGPGALFRRRLFLRHHHRPRFDHPQPSVGPAGERGREDARASDGAPHNLCYMGHASASARVRAKKPLEKRVPAHRHGL